MSATKPCEGDDRRGLYNSNSHLQAHLADLTVRGATWGNLFASCRGAWSRSEYVGAL